MPERTSTRAFLFADQSSTLLALLFVTAAIGKLVRYLPWWGLALVAVVELSGLWLLVRHARPLLPRITPRGAALLLVALFALLSAIALAGHPAVERFVESHEGLGSDRDEALEVAVRALAAASNPYRVELSTGNPVSPLPGELLLAAPFVWLGVSGFQTVFWLFGWFSVSALRFGGPRALLTLIGLLALSPGAFHELLTAGDLLAVSLYNAVACAWLLLPRSGHPKLDWKDLGGAALLGLALSSRPTFLLLVPLLAAALAAKRGARVALVVSALSVGLASILTGFFTAGLEIERSPFHLLITVDELAFRGASLTVVLISALIALLGARSIYRAGGEGFDAAAALVLFVPVAVTTALASRTLGAESVERFLWYSLASLPFAATALVGGLTEPDSARRSSRGLRAAPS